MSVKNVAFALSYDDYSYFNRLFKKTTLEVTGGRLVPAWLEADAESLKGTVKELPTRDEIDVPVDEMLIVELYSK